MAFLQEYTMLDELGRGGFATVYKVRHNELGYIRAVRVLNETIVDSNSPTYQKFLRECKVLLRLGNGNHPNIVHIYQPRLLDNKALVEMDYVDGLDIQHYLKQNQNFVPADEVIRMALQMSSALAYCHDDIYRFCMDRETDNLQDDPNDGSKVLMNDQTRKRLIEKYKVIHNDIHSGNIMRREDGKFVLLDFGLAINGDEVVRSSRRKNGAPEYKAPEKWDDESILTEQSDIYSFGIVLYQYLAGRVPFPFNTKNSNKTEAEYLLSKAHQNATPPSLEVLRKDFFEKKSVGQEYKKDYPQWLEDVIFKCLNKDPKDRFRNGKELYDCVKMHVLEETKSSKEVENKLVELTTRNKTLETEVGGLQDANTMLNTALNEKQNTLVRTEQLLREANEQTDTIKQEKQLLQKELERLKKDGAVGTGKWKVLAAFLLLALLTCGGLLWHIYSSDDAVSFLEPQPENTAKVDSLQEVIVLLQQDTTRLHQLLLNDNPDGQMLEQTRQISELQSENATLKANSEYAGHTAKYWHDNRLYNGHDAKYWYDNKLYNGHDAKYWYDNKLYNGHDAKYWYDDKLYNGHDAKYWYDNKLYNGYDAKYWYDKRLYSGHDAKYWYDNSLYKGQTAQQWYNQVSQKEQIIKGLEAQIKEKDREISALKKY